jgi:hypothetical protein
MDPAKIGMREFRHNFGEYAEASKPVAVTKHGRTVGLYIPLRRKPAPEDLARFEEAGKALHDWMDAKGISEDALVEEFKRLRKEARKRRG